MLTPKPKVWKLWKNKKSSLMNWNVQPLLPKRKLPRWELNWKPAAQQTSNTSAMLQCWCCLSDKVKILFELCNARQMNSHYFLQKGMLSLSELLPEHTALFWKVQPFDFSWPNHVKSWNLCPPLINNIISAKRLLNFEVINSMVTFTCFCG